MRLDGLAANISLEENGTKNKPVNARPTTFPSVYSMKISLIKNNRMLLHSIYIF